MNWFPSELGTSVRGQETRVMDGYTGPRKKFDDTFSRLDTIHERGGLTNGHTPGDSKDNAYA